MLNKTQAAAVTKAAGKIDLGQLDATAGEKLIADVAKQTKASPEEVRSKLAELGAQWSYNPAAGS